MNGLCREMNINVSGVYFALLHVFDLLGLSL